MEGIDGKTMMNFIEFGGMIFSITRCGFQDGEELPSGKKEKTMENHHFQWVNPLFLWPFSIAMLNYQRVSSVVAI